jgi:hypothetical protein
LAAANLRESLSVSKRAAQKFDIQRFDLRGQNDAGVKEQYEVKVSNRFANWENLDDNVSIIRAWGNIRDNIKILAEESLAHDESKQHKL